MFPRFNIIRRDAGEILGSVTALTFGNETWIGDGFIGCLMAGNKFIFGRWYSHGDSWAFVPDDPAVIETLSLDTDWAILDGYWGEQRRTGT